MTHDILLPAGVRRIVDQAEAAVWRGRRELIDRYGRPDDIARSNAAAFADLGWALTRVRRLAKILRYAFVVLAAWLEIEVATVSASRTAGALAGSSRADGNAGCRRGAGGPTPRKPRFVLSTPYRVRFDDAPLQPQPAHLAHLAPNKLRTLARRLEALTQALLDPMPLVRRLARRQRRDNCFIGGVAPRRPPRVAQRAFLEELDEIRAQARFELRERRWRLRQDSS